ncbi:MAG: hypothetical protein F9K25_08695 [Candidatus Contendobacter sp.]|nr:MAG: hypothetical protein F9K25_08695 [Candidatus Contendobacter sp.]
MRGFRQRSSGIFALAAVCVLAASMTAFAETTDSAGGSSPPVGVESDNASASKQVLQARIQELKELSASMDAVQANLAKVAERALKDSDSAPSLTERRRYEQLYAETNARLGELQTTRTEIARLLGQLETQLEVLKHGR